MNKYWTQEQDYYFFQVREAPSTELGNKIYTKYLHSIFVKMAETILNRYFLANGNNKVLAERSDEVIADAVSKAYQSIFRFDVGKGGKPFSYVQAVIKYYYLDLIARSRQFKTSGDNTLSLSDLEKEYDFVSIESEPNLDVYDVLVDTIRQRCETNDVVIAALIDCLQTYRPTSRQFISYYLMSSTGLHHSSILARMKEFNIDGLIFQNFSRINNYFEEFFKSMKVSERQKKNYKYLLEKMDEYDSARKSKKTQATKSSHQMA